MKFKILITLLLCITISQAQSKSEKKKELAVKNSFWGAKDAYKNANTIPNKWKDESAVIIYKNINYTYVKSGKKITYKTSYRMRIKLLDKNAVKEYSEFSFKKNFRSNRVNMYRNKMGTVYFAVKIIKEDGKEILVDVNKDAVKADDGYKIAISNLEVNDIVDYYYHTIEPFQSKYGYSFNPEERFLSSIYPIMNFKLRLESQNDFFINFKSLNGAPELKKVESNQKNSRVYELIETDIAKSDFPIWFYPLLEVPSIKFQIYFAKGITQEKNMSAFLSEKESIIKTSVSKEDVLRVYKNKYKVDIIKVPKDFNKQVFKSDREKVIAYYYYIRHHYYTRYIEIMMAYDAKIIDPYDNFYGNYKFIDSPTKFIRHFTGFLRVNKISYDIIVGTKRYNGDIKDLIIENNTEVLVRVNTKEPLFAQFFNPHTSINQIDPLLHDTNSYVLSPDSRHKLKTVKKGTIPSVAYQKNKISKKISLELLDDFSTFSVKTENSYVGYTKHAEQLDRLYFYDYVYEDYDKYQSKKFITYLKNKKKRTKFEKEFNAIKSKLKDLQIKKIRKTAKNEFSLNEIENYSYKLTNTGRFGLDDVFSY